MIPYILESQSCDTLFPFLFGVIVAVEYSSFDLPLDVEEAENRLLAFEEAGNPADVGVVAGLGFGVEGVDFAEAAPADMAFLRSTSLTLMLRRLVCDARSVS